MNTTKGYVPGIEDIQSDGTNKKRVISSLLASIPMVINIAIGILIGLGIYSFSNSILWAIVGMFLIAGSQNIIISIVAYPAIEYYFTGGLTVFSYAVLGANALLLLWAFIMAKLTSK